MRRKGIGPSDSRRKAAADATLDRLELRPTEALIGLEVAALGPLVPGFTSTRRGPGRAPDARDHVAEDLLLEGRERRDGEHDSHRRRRRGVLSQPATRSGERRASTMPAGMPRVAFGTSDGVRRRLPGPMRTAESCGGPIERRGIAPEHERAS